MNTVLSVGKMNTLIVLSTTSDGYKLGIEGQSIFAHLPRPASPTELQLGTSLDVFVYRDNEGRLVATLAVPYGQVGDYRTLKVKEVVADLGVFLDWGIEKDLFVPYREQVCEMVVGQSYVVHIYEDSSGRIAGTTRLRPRLARSRPPYTVGQKVQLLVYQKTQMGLNAVVNNKYSGLIFKDDIAQNLEIGDEVEGYIKAIRADSKIDLELRNASDQFENREDLAKVIMSKLKAAGGRLEINAKSSAKDINVVFGASRKQFKRALGYLYKKRWVDVDENGMSLSKK